MIITSKQPNIGTRILYDKFWAGHRQDIRESIRGQLFGTDKSIMFEMRTFRIKVNSLLNKM